MIHPVGRALLRLARPYPWVMPAMVFLGLLASLAEGLGIGLLIPVLDELLAQRGADSAPGAMSQALRSATAWIPAEYRLEALAAVIVLLVGLKTVILVANGGVATWISSRISHDLRVMVAGRLLHSDYAFVTRLQQGTLVNLLETQTYRVGEAVTLLAAFVSSACTVFVFALLLALLSWKLALLVLAVIAPVSLLIRLMSRRSRRLGNLLLQAHSVLSARLLELVGSLRTIRLFNAEPAEAGRIASASDRVRRETLRTELVTGSIQPVSEFLYVPVFLGVLAYSLGTGIGLPTLLAFMALLYRLQTPLKRLDHVRVALSSYAAAVEDLDELREAADRHPEQSGSHAASPIAHGIAFEHVGFTYDGATSPALSDVSCEIRRGEVVAVCGASGAGKSTLVNLLCKLYQPGAGRILVDGVPLAELDTRAWRDRIALAGQDVDLLDGTIRQNLTLGSPDASADEIERALRQSNSTDFMRGLPAGLDAQAGPRGRNLSGGQRQRIGLARAFARRPDLLILDEATNAVDNVTEAEILQAIDALAGSCTILVIAHRMGTVRRADRVIVLDAGRIVEQGTPEELLRSDGPLARQRALE